MAHPTHSDLGSALEQRLLRQVASGDSAAFATIYTAYEGRLYGFCHRLTGSDADSADLVQETFLRVMARIPEMDTSTLNLSAYLYTTARNLFYKQVDKAKRIQLEERMEDRAGPSSAFDEQPEAAALLTAQQVEVRNAHERLSPRQRMVLSLREVEDRSYADIGTVLGMNENAVAQLLSRARLRLREELRIEQVDVSKLPEECRKRLPAISAYMDGQLKGNRRDEFERHIEDCKHCRAVLAAFGDASHRYRAFLPLALPLAALWPATAHAAAGAGLIHSAADAIAAHGAATSGGGVAAGSAGAGGVAGSGVGGAAGAAGAAGFGGIGAFAAAAAVGILVVGGAGAYGIKQLVDGSSKRGAVSVTDSIPEPSTSGGGSGTSMVDGAVVTFPKQGAALLGLTAARPTHPHSSNHLTPPTGLPVTSGSPTAPSISSQSSSSGTSTSSPPGSSTSSPPGSSTSSPPGSSTSSPPGSSTTTEPRTSTSNTSSTSTTTAPPTTRTRTTRTTPATTTAAAPATSAPPANTAVGPAASAPPATPATTPATPATTAATPATTATTATTTSPPPTTTVPSVGPPVFTAVSITFSGQSIHVIVRNDGGPAAAGQRLRLALKIGGTQVQVRTIAIGELGAGLSRTIPTRVPCLGAEYILPVVASFSGPYPPGSPLSAQVTITC